MSRYTCGFSSDMPPELCAALLESDELVDLAPGRHVDVPLY
ncbi:MULTISPECIES: hypothetical protein [unclassified Massilia]|nr:MULTISPECIES: hypothetical protein [unclassified Massilia]